MDKLFPHRAGKEVDSELKSIDFRLSETETDHKRFNFHVLRKSYYVKLETIGVTLCCCH